MRGRRTGRCLLYLVLLLAVVPGCQVLQRSRPVVVQVRDADTKKPVPNAEVRLSYPLAQSPLGPGSVFETSGADGIARLRAVDEEGGVVIRAAAPHYLSREKVVPLQTLQAIEPGHLFEPGERRPVNFVVELFAEEPRPSIVLILPNRYRGQVKAEVQVQEDAPYTPGQREFREVVPPSGQVRVTGPDLFRYVSSPDFTARYADGQPLGPNAKGLEMGFWCIKSEGRFCTFLVGTRNDYDYYRPKIKEDWGEIPPDPNKRGGRGRGGRRGGSQAPADPGQSSP